jgi:signal transduction histidine kinase
VIQLDERLPPVFGDRVMLEQVLVNLTRNAIEAMGEYDHNARRARREVTIRTQKVDENVLITVDDCGAGVSPELQERLFEPFRSTKSKGMGMGLNVSKGIVEQHLGRLWYESNPDGGARFCVSLPIAAQPLHEPVVRS